MKYHCEIFTAQVDSIAATSETPFYKWRTYRECQKF